MPPRVVSTGLVAGLVMNVFGWLGNQLLLGREWEAAIAGSPFAAMRTRTIWHELGSLAPDFVYGLALAWLFVVTARAFGPSRAQAYSGAVVVWLVAIATPLLGTANAQLMPWRVTLLTVVLALVIMVPLAELLWWRLGSTVGRASAPGG
ncbi:MAG: hypothetical protein R3E10_09275 [Gemmatimonadota bacterium]